MEKATQQAGHATALQRAPSGAVSIALDAEPMAYSSFAEALAGSPRMTAQRLQLQALGLMQGEGIESQASAEVLQLTVARPDFEMVDSTAPEKTKIREVEFQGRPVSNVKRKQGHHILAYTVFEAGVTNAIVGKTYIQAVEGLRALASKLRDLPGFVYGYQPNVASRESELAAFEARADGIVSGTEKIEDLNKVEVLGKLIEKYLAMRNSLPFTARDKRAGKPDSKDVAEEDGPNKFDRQGATEVKNFKPKSPLVSGKLAPDDLNGIVDSIGRVVDYHKPSKADQDEIRVRKVVEQVLKSIFQAYPDQIKEEWREDIEEKFTEVFNSRIKHATENAEKRRAEKAPAPPKTKKRKKK